MKSPAEELAALPEAQRNEFMATLSEAQFDELLCDWRGFLARPNQIAPDGDWDIWMILAGRGFGKTRSGAEWVREQVKAVAKRIALVISLYHCLFISPFISPSAYITVCAHMSLLKNRVTGHQSGFWPSIRFLISVV